VDSFIPQFYITIDGTDVSDEIIDVLRELVVDTSLSLPAMFTIFLHDDSLAWIDSPRFEIGNEVKIKADTALAGDSQRGLLIEGEITSIEPDFSSEGQTSVLVRGYTKAHRLHHGKKTRTFLGHSDSDIVRKIAGEVGLSPEVDETRVVYDYVLQNNQTNMAFLQVRARRNGYQVYAADGTLYFKKGDARQDDGPEIKLGETLRYFRPRMASMHQADTIMVTGWDPKAKQVISSQTAPNSRMNQGGMRQPGGQVATVFGAAEAVLVDQPVFTVDEANALAQGLANDLSGQFIQAEGRCEGDPRIKAGHTITIKGIGDRFSGQYFVTSASHIFNDQGYETEFTINGRQPNTVSHLLGANGQDEESQGLIRGVVVGLVTNLNDPDKLGRIKVKYPWLGDNIESDWLRVAAPNAGPERGFFYLPEVNDEVLLAFEHGDVHRPYMIGALWNNEDKPPEPTGAAVENGVVNKRIIQSRSGHIIVLDDTAGSEQIIVRDMTGSNEVVIDSSQNTMTIKVDQDLIVKANGKIDMQATGDVSIKGANLNLEGQQKGELKALQVAVNGSTKVDVKGGMINLN